MMIIDMTPHLVPAFVSLLALAVVAGVAIVASVSRPLHHGRSGTPKAA